MWAESRVYEFKMAEVQPFSEEGLQCGCGRLRKRWEVRRRKRKYSQGVGWNIHVVVRSPRSGQDLGGSVSLSQTQKSSVNEGRLASFVVTVR